MMYQLLVLVVLASCSYAANETKSAIVVLKSDKVNGVVQFTEVDGKVRVNGTIQGLEPNHEHGFHIHARGDLREGCASTLSHFNPHNQKHGAPNATVRHVGDLGNVKADANGVATIDFLDSVIALSGEHNIIGRGVVVHSDKDDLGTGEGDSLTTGNAGARIACGVIGTLNESGASSIVVSSLVLLTGVAISLLKSVV